MKVILFVISFSLLIISCEKNKDTAGVASFNADHGSVYISNEGNFQSGNSSISNFNPSDNIIVADAFRASNNSSLGDICQSMNIIDGNLFAVVNNSGKIEVCNTYSMKKINTISGMVSPRYIIAASNNKAYVSDGYANKIWIINLINFTVSGSINLNGFLEQMISVNNKIYVTNSSSDYLYEINADTDILSDSIQISKGANSIRQDSNGKLWVLCSGDYMQTYNGAIFRIDPATKQVEFTQSFPANKFPSRLCINKTRDTLYFINQDIWQMSIANSTLPSNPFLASTSNNFYGLSVDTIKNEIYISDAIDYIQRGKILRYNSNGIFISDFLAGIIPGDFLIVP